MNDESLTGVLDIVSGERDPRNLMLVFSILKVLMVEWNISNYVQVWILSFPVYKGVDIGLMDS
jgi:DNA repair/transcription protein MET18/MMS19